VKSQKKNKRKAPKSASSKVPSIGFLLVPDPEPPGIGDALVPEPPATLAFPAMFDEILSRLREDTAAKRALMELHLAGIDDPILIVVLLGNIWNALHTTAATSKLKDIPDVSWDVIQDLPGEMELIADQLKKIQTHGAWIELFFARHWLALPDALRAYAERLQVKVSELQRQKRGMDPGTLDKLKLIGYVRKAAGRSLSRPLADLINAFNRMADERNNVTLKLGMVTEESLNVLWGKYSELPELASDLLKPLPLINLPSRR
jgi:hypothetical protein